MELYQFWVLLSIFFNIPINIYPKPISMIQNIWLSKLISSEPRNIDNNSNNIEDEINIFGDNLIENTFLNSIGLQYLNLLYG